MAECAKLDSSSSTGAGTRDRLQKKFKELGDERVGREVASGGKKAELEKDKKRIAFMKLMNEDKTGKVRELKEAVTDLKRKVERAGKLNMLKREDLEPVANAIQRKRMTIDSVMNDPIFAVIFISSFIFLTKQIRKSRIWNRSLRQLRLKKREFLQKSSRPKSKRKRSELKSANILRRMTSNKQNSTSLLLKMPQSRYRFHLSCRRVLATLKPLLAFARG